MAGTGRYDIRLLRPDDVERLMVLERAKWTAEQATTEAELLARIRTWPTLSAGVFAAGSGEALVSVFLKPVTEQALTTATTWAELARVEPPDPAARDLFGISLSSIDADAVDALDERMWPVLLKGGWRYIYLGTPLPGLRSWRRRHPDADVAEYVHGTRNGLPLDPQLRYYRSKGHHEIVAVHAGYFPHEASLDHGATIRRRVPGSGLAPLWRRLPLPVQTGLTRVALAARRSPRGRAAAGAHGVGGSRPGGSGAAA